MEDLTNLIIKFECGELENSECLELFSRLIQNGMAWTLNGHYGRVANAFIEAGLLTREGIIEYYADIEEGI